MSSNRPDSKAIFISGGIGDVLAVSCFIEILPKVEKVFYATQPWKDIVPILSQLFPNAEHHCIWHDWSQRKAFYTLREFSQACLDKSVASAVDWSIRTVFTSDSKFIICPWLKLRENSTRFSLPETYCVVCPRSTDKSVKERDLTWQEMQNVLEWSSRTKIPLVLVYNGSDLIQVPEQVLNLQNQTDILETMAVVEHASYYVGIDSCQSQVATKVLPADRLLIKSVNPHYYQSLKWYCAPHADYPFVVKEINKFNLNCLERSYDSWK